MREKLLMVGMMVIAVTMGLVACGGDDGTNGTNGTNGATGNTAPIANAGADQKVASSGIMVALNGSGSSDPDGGLNFLLARHPMMVYIYTP